MKICSKCDTDKEDNKFYVRNDTGGLRSWCKECCKGDVAERDPTKTWRHKAKRTLIDEHGGKCVDCGYTGPPYQFDFDHRDPKQKKFGIGKLGYGIEKLREEAKKCDLVCSRCHRDRTHIQRCSGCEMCIG